MEDYKIRLDAFEGPMDLLMHLIEKNKIDVYDIPMAVLTGQYMAYLRRLRQFDIEVASEFLVMAATLLLIKSRLMLPKPPQEEEEAEAPSAGAAAGAAMARASDAEAASPTAKRRVVEALTASPAVVVPRKVTVAV